MYKLIKCYLIFPLATAIYLDAVNPKQEIFGLSNPSDFPTCPIDTPLSCSNSTPIADSCCFESPGGIMLQTQFWDYYPPIGPNDTFTLHGLWPDNCDGSYEQFCDTKLNIKEVKSIIIDEFKDEVLYEKMRRYWKNFNGNDESLWIHEFNKHGTCIKTINPSCYTQFKQNKNVYDFFSISMNIYETLPTFKFLEIEGIVPSRTATYSKKQISEALSRNFGDKKVYFKCNKYNGLQEIWYYHYIHGSLKQEEFERISSLLEPNCPEEGIKFFPKDSSNQPPSTPKPPTIPDKGYIKLGDHSGCLISNGQWYNYGTCATYQISKSQFGGYNLKSSKGYCGISNFGEFNCNKLNQPSQYQFQYDKNTGVIGYGGKSQWCYNYDGSHGNGKYRQIPVILSDNCDDPFKLILK